MASSDPGFRRGQVTVDDASIHVVEAGDPDGVPFLFVHGWPESWRSWQSVMARASTSVLMRRCRFEVLHDPAHPSAVVLPVLGESGQAERVLE